MTNRDVEEKIENLHELCSLFEEVASSADDAYFLSKKEKSTLARIAKKTRILTMVWYEADDSQKTLVTPKINVTYRSFYKDPDFFAMLTFLRDERERIWKERMQGFLV